jgi:hypothetical protein
MMSFAPCTGLQVQLLREEEEKSVRFCFGPEHYLKENGQEDKDPEYFFFKYIGGSGSKGYSYVLPSLAPIDFVAGGKESFRNLFTIMTPNNEYNRYDIIFAKLCDTMTRERPQGTPSC